MAEEKSAKVEAKVPAPLMKGDKHIWGIFIALCVISIVELYSASSREVGTTMFGVIKPLLRHMGLLALGFAIVWGISRKHYARLLPFCFIFILVSVVLMAYVMVAGEVINGARRSFTVPGIGIQIFPAEMIKLSAVLAIAMIMTRNQNPNSVGITRKGAFMAAIVIMIMSGLLIQQGLTNTILLVMISYAMMVISGVKMKHLGTVTAVYFGVAALFLIIMLALPDGLPRMETWTSRLSDHFDEKKELYELPKIPSDQQQEAYSMMAQANGGILGVMPGNSREASRLPLAFSDYIYAIIVEETGLVGGLVVLVLYLWLLGRAAGIASRCTRTMPALLVIGMAVLITFQALFHMAIVTGVAPVSGQPLPLISKGGTSILITSICFGIMLSVSRSATRQKAKPKEISEELEALPAEMREENPMQL